MPLAAVEIAGFRLYAYTFFLTLGFISGFLWTFREARTQGVPQEKIAPLIFPIFVTSLLGARLYFALGAWLHTQGNAAFWGLLVEGGLAFYGGLLATLILLFTLGPFLEVPRAKLLNTFAPGLLLAQAIGRLGCLVHGCCYGRWCTLPWAIESRSPPGSPNHGLLLHPSQAYEIFGVLIIFFFCVRANRRPHTTWPAWRLYLLGYGMLRFGVEFTRGDELRGFLGPLSLSQWVSLLLVSFSVFLDFRSKGNHNETPHEA